MQAPQCFFVFFSVARSSAVKHLCVCVQSIQWCRPLHLTFSPVGLDLDALLCVLNGGGELADGGVARGAVGVEDVVGGILVDGVGEVLGSLVELASHKHLVSELLVTGGGFLLFGRHLQKCVQFCFARVVVVEGVAVNVRGGDDGKGDETSRVSRL